MGLTEWFLAFLFVYLLLAVILFIYHRDEEDDPEAESIESPRSHSSVHPSAAGSRPSPADASGVVVCRVCGTENRSTYTYCKGCLNKFGSP